MFQGRDCGLKISVVVLLLCKGKEMLMEVTAKTIQSRKLFPKWHLPPMKNMSKSCGLCDQTGHTRFTCLLLLQCGCVLKETRERNDIICHLVLPDGFQRTAVEKGIPVHDSFPSKHVGAVVMHEMAHNPNNNIDLFNVFQSIITTTLVPSIHLFLLTLNEAFFHVMFSTVCDN